MATIKFKDSLEINAILGNCVNKNMSIEAILGLIDLKDEIQIITDKYRKALSSIMDLYGIQPINGSYSWNDNEKQMEISGKIEELVMTEVELANSNFMTDAEIVGMTDGLSISNISFLRKFLKKN